MEGPTDDVEINLLRERQIRNFLATLLLSQGTPMVLAGDEFGRTQNGNNNAYCQDSEISWVNWAIEDKGETLIRFVKKLTWIRQEYPMLHYTRFLNGELKENIETRDVTWIKPDGEVFEDGDWSRAGDRIFGMLLDIRGYATEDTRERAHSPLLLLFNAYHEDFPFTLPEHLGGSHWVRMLDTNRPDAEDERDLISGTDISLTSRSFQLLRLSLKDG